MASAQHSVTIKRPVADVFAFVADGENARQWRPSVLDMAHLSGEGVGAVYARGPKARAAGASRRTTR